MKIRVAYLVSVLMLPGVVQGASIQASGAARVISVIDHGALGNDGNDDAAGIQAAISAASAGDTVLIPGGIYQVSRAVVAKSGVKIKGESKSDTIIEFSGVEGFAMIDLSNVSNVEMTEFTLDGKMKNLANGIFATNGVGHEIHSISIKNLRYDGFGPHGILFDGNKDWKKSVSHSLLSGNEFSNIGVDSEWGAAIRFSNGASHNHAVGNTIKDTGRGGILANNGATDLIISGNIISGIGISAEGLSIEIHTQCDRAIIEDNVVEHWISLDKTSGSAVRRNMVGSDKVGDWKYAGLELAGGSNNIFTENKVDRGAKIGISVSIDYPKEYVFWGRNSINGMADWGVQLQGDSIGLSYQYFHKNLFLNTYRNHAQSSHENQGHGFRVNGNSRHITMEENVIQGNEGVGVEFSGEGIDQFSFIRNLIVGNRHGAVTTYPGNDLLWVGNNVSGNKSDAVPLSAGFKRSAIPFAGFESPVTVGVNEELSFSNSSFSNNPGGSIAHVLWDLGQGLPSTQASPIHVYTKPGTYLVTLIVWDEKGRAGRKEKLISVTARSDG